MNCCSSWLVASSALASALELEAESSQAAALITNSASAEVRKMDCLADCSAKVLSSVNLSEFKGSLIVRLRVRNILYTCRVGESEIAHRSSFTQ